MLKNSLFRVVVIIAATAFCLLPSTGRLAAQAPPTPPPTEELGPDQLQAICNAIDTLCNTLTKKRLTAKKNAMPPEIKLADLGTKPGSPFMVTCANEPGGRWTRDTSNTVKINKNLWKPSLMAFTPWLSGGPTSPADLAIFTGATLAHEYAHTRQAYNLVQTPTGGITGATPADTRALASGEVFAASVELAIIQAHLGSTFYGIARLVGLTDYINYYTQLRNRVTG